MTNRNRNHKPKTSADFERLAAYWGRIADGYWRQGSASEAGNAASHSAHYALLALVNAPHDPDPFPEGTAA
jgi:hypothetical protein